jgi:transcriptional regulator with XRE-family HTH domain
MPFSDRLKALRTAKGLSQAGLARATGLSVSLVAQLEQGLTADPKLSTLKALAAALGCTLDDLAQEDAADETIVPEGTPEVREPPPARKPGRKPKGGK